MRIKDILCVLLPASFIVGCGINNNVSFSLQQGACADGTSGAPYCMAVTIQNNAGGQNWINSSNLPIQSLNLSVTSQANNVNYPSVQGSAWDPQNCLGSTISPGNTCTFYLQLTGESVPVGQKQAINLTASYTIDSNLFGNSSQTASTSTTLYQRPSLIVSSNYGSGINYSESGISSVYAAESGTYSAVQSNANDNYYGFLYLATGNGLFLSGNQSYAYNMIESITGVNNILISGNMAYPISNSLSYIYSSSFKPLAGTYWSNYAPTATGVAANTAITALGKIFVNTTNNVFLCNSLSSNPSGCNNEGISPPGQINILGYAPLGISNTSAPLTGLVVGTTSGLYVESGSLGISTNLWSPVYLDVNATQPLTTSVTKIVADNNQNLYIADTNNTLYEMSINKGNYATNLTTIPTSYGQIRAMVYDNAGQVLYVGTTGGNIFGCFASNGGFNCGTPVATNIFADNLFGLNIVSTISQN